MEETFESICEKMNRQFDLLYPTIDFNSSKMTSSELDRHLTSSTIDYKYLSKENIQKYAQVILLIHQLAGNKYVLQEITLMEKFT